MKKKQKRYFSRGALTVSGRCVSLCCSFMPTVLTITNSFMTQSEDHRQLRAGLSERDLRQELHHQDTINLKFIPDKVTLQPVFYRAAEKPGLSAINSGTQSFSSRADRAGAARRSRPSRPTASRAGAARSADGIFFCLCYPDAHAVSGHARAELSGEPTGSALLNTRWAIILPGAFAPFSVFLLTKSMRRIPVFADRVGEARWRGRVAHFLEHLPAAVPQRAVFHRDSCVHRLLEHGRAAAHSAARRVAAAAFRVSLQINAGEIGIAFAVAVVYMIPGLLLFLHGEAYLVEGITYAGSVKG